MKRFLSADQQLESPPRRATILIADDEVEVRELMRQILEGHYRVVEARNGKDILDEIAREHIDLLILDLVMPNLEGMETLQWLRRNHPQVSVLVVSGAFGGSLLACAKALGAHAAMKKPFSSETLLTNVHELLATR